MLKETESNKCQVNLRILPSLLSYPAFLRVLVFRVLPTKQDFWHFFCLLSDMQGNHTFLMNDYHYLHLNPAAEGIIIISLSAVFMCSIHPNTYRSPYRTWWTPRSRLSRKPLNRIGWDTSNTVENATENQKNKPLTPFGVKAIQQSSAFTSNPGSPGGPWIPGRPSSACTSNQN